MEVTLIENRELIPLTRDEWNALVERNDVRTIFQTYEWFDCWWRTFGDRHRLYFLLLRRDGRPIGFAPLMIVRTRWGRRELQFVGAGNADYLDFVIAEDKAAGIEQCLSFLRARRDAWDRIGLRNIPAESVTARAIKRCCRSVALPLVREAETPCPTLLIRDREPQARALTAKYSMRRPLNQLRHLGPVKCRELRESSEIAAALPSFFAQHIARWRASDSPSLFTDQRQRNFYQALAIALGATGWLLFSVIEVGGTAVAFHFGFDYADCVIWYKPSYSPKHARYSPGVLMVRHLIEHALARGRKEVDFTIGDEGFKSRFTNLRRHNHGFRIYPGAAGHGGALIVRAHVTLRRLQLRVARWIRAVARRAKA